MNFTGKAVWEGEAEGKALVSEDPISFLGGVDSETGEIVESGHQLEGKSLKNRVLIFPHGKGSTVGSYVIYQLALNEVAPAAMINQISEPIVAVGAIIAEIPLVHKLNRNPIKNIENGNRISVKGKNVRLKK
ncbi:hypothetical protein AKJ41_02665 [candidate division MSBL1 archaeon SCGC-AAA259O05]|uniref:Phosphomevalonate dehydratase small subunit n=1 Tax=candidate division MSBL1 archaeon SCGC-AAA259O05 TaxID=1698271 RepID=A0A133V3V1_9EURY|nr:hypothetical protein AKJ41_02665 [candidate division MSBL1 archaeon SCGC-AAA259O05]